jgi:hypothetical protein
MRNMLAFLAAVTLTVIAVGWYLDWFALHRVPADSGHRSWTVDMNTEKIGKDLTEAEHKVQQKIEEKSKANSSTAATLPSKPEPIKQADPIKPAVGAALRKIEGYIDQPER